jgi:thiol-disulfide isomerase/thioredoxin
VFGATARLGAIGAFLLFLAFIAGIGWNLRQGRTPDCHCFGELHSSPAGWHTIIRNSVFALMALIVVIAGGRAPVETIENLSGTEKVGLWLTLLIVALGIGLAWLLDRIAKQQQELRAEIEALQTASLFAGLETAPATPVTPTTVAIQPIVDPVGEPAPSFDLPTLDGGRLTLDDLRAEGKPALLLFSAPDCGFCNAMYPEVAEWATRFGSELSVTVIGRGDLDANREKLAGHAFTHTAVDEDTAVGAAYDAIATPSAVIVLPNGTLLGSVAKGRPEIQKLVGRTLRQRQQQRAQAPAAQEPAVVAPEPVAEPAIESWPAPSFEVATPDGGTMTLSSLLDKGKPVLVIFWSTGCGFCQRFAPEVGEWTRRFGNEVTIALLTDVGDEAIREQMVTHGFRNVGLQEGREVMQQYGGNGTPSAVLIQPDGFVQDEVATGAPMIRKLIGRVINRSGQRPAPAAAPLVPAAADTASENGSEHDPEELIRQSLLESLKGPELGAEGSRLPWATLDGGYVGLDEYLGREVTLLFWGVDCEFSQRILPDLKEWEQEAGEAIDDVLIISSGDVEANRAQGLRTRIVLDDSFAAGNDFGVSGTPAAVRLDARGRVASPLAVGADAVLDLLYDQIEAPADTAVT